MNHRSIRDIFTALAVLCAVTASAASAYGIPYFP